MRERWRSYLETVRTNHWAIMLMRRARPDRARLTAVLGGCLIAGLALGAGAALLRPAPSVELPAPTVLAPGPVMREEVPRAEARTVSTELLRPVSGAVVGEYGWHWSSVYRDWRLHPGVDLSASAGEPVVAMASGTVLSVDLLPSRMYRLVIDHPYVGQASYGNLGEVSVSPGQRVTPGTVVGTIGECLPYSDGIGPHLRLELRVGDRLIDPQPLIDGAWPKAENR